MTKPATTTSFVSQARAAGAEWQATWPALPDEARSPGSYEGRGPYAFVLPDDHRWLNLLPEARDIAQSRFEAAGIHWHGDGTGPNPHTVSSQIQCLNALAPFVSAPSGLKRIFGGVLPIDEVLQFEASTPSPFDFADHVVFEWQGGADHLSEWGPRAVRGSKATSADAALRYRSTTGSVEIALVEWKYTESYPHRGRLHGTAKYHEGRLARYERLLWGAQGVVRPDLGFDYEDLFAEPVYQLARTQALAAAMEAAGDQGAERVRFVYAAPGGNDGLLRQSLGSRRFERYVASHGGHLANAWRRALRQPDRFAYLDTARFMADDCPVVSGFRERYWPLGLPSASQPPPEIGG